MGRSRYIAQAGVIAALYAVLTILGMQLTGTLSWGLVQLRASEALTVVAVLTPAAIPGLWLGTLVANLFLVPQVGPIAMLDVVFGSTATLLGAIWTWRFRARRGVALLGPVIFNALIIPAYLPLMLVGLGLYEVPLLGVDLEGSWFAMYLFGVVSIAIGQTIVVYGLGWPLLAVLDRTRAFRVEGESTTGQPEEHREEV
jgi:uncharacterized membrane protein